MKERELREHAECNYCGRKVGVCRSPWFQVIEVKTFAIELSAIQRQTGLAMMLNPMLAMHMGPDEDMATVVDTEKTTMCFECWAEKMPKPAAQEAT